MNIGIIGSGAVARALGRGFLSSGHPVKLGSRNPEKLNDWLEEVGNPAASAGTNSEAAAFGDVIVLATGWDGTKNAIELAGKENLAGKTVIDVTNPLDFTEGPPPKLAVRYPASGGELVQEWMPDANVVKAFNIIASHTMINPRMQGGTPDMFIAGNSPEAKEQVAEIARNWGWENVHDMGDITSSYWLESFAMLWIHFAFKNNHWTHAFKLLMK